MSRRDRKLSMDVLSLPSLIQLILRNANYKQIAKAIQEGALVGEVDSNGQTALHVAASLGARAICKVLIKKKANINARDHTGYTPLHTAIVNGKAQVTELLIKKGAEVCALTNELSSPLHYAVHMNLQDHIYLRILSLLIKYSATSEETRLNGANSGSSSGSGGNQASGVSSSNFYSFDIINHCNATAETPLYRAAFKGRALGVLFLLKHGADPNKATKFGLTSLHVACLYGWTTVVEALLLYGADVSLKSDQGTCMDIAQKTNNRDVITLLFRVCDGDRRNVTPSDALLELERKINVTFSLRIRPHRIDVKPDDSGFFVKAQAYGSVASIRGNSMVASPTRNSKSKEGSNFKEDIKQHFKVINTLGEGKFGKVYSAVHRESGFVVAIKTMIIKDLAKATVEREITVLQHCHHPNIVQYYGSFYGDDDLIINIIMEYCSIGDVLKLTDGIKRPLQEDEIAALVESVLKGLSYLHKNNIIHRDVKAQNVLISQHGCTKIADFGLAKRLEQQMPLTTVGTPLFMAPEVLAGESYDYTADIWSLGITIIQIAEGQPPFIDKNLLQAMILITTGTPPTLKEPTRFSSKFRDFISVCLDRTPSRRPSCDYLLVDRFIADTPQTHEKILQKLVEEFLENNQGTLTSTSVSATNNNTQNITAKNDSKVQQIEKPTKQTTIRQSSLVLPVSTHDLSDVQDTRKLLRTDITPIAEPQKLQPENLESETKEFRETGALTSRIRMTSDGSFMGEASILKDLVEKVYTEIQHYDTGDVLFDKAFRTSIADNFAQISHLEDNLSWLLSLFWTIKNTNTYGSSK